jgi:RHS repeat-associated protein
MSPSSGSGEVGLPLSTTTGSWSNPCPGDGVIDYWYQWYDGATAISSPSGSGTFASSYVTQPPDAGSTQTVTVKGCNDFGCGTAATATGSFSTFVVSMGAREYWPMWSHGPLAVNEATGNLVLSVPTPSYPTAVGSLGFSLSYNAQTSQASPGLGAGWMLSAGDGSLSPPVQLIDVSGLPAEKLAWPDGSDDIYSAVGSSNVYRPALADGSKLTHDPVARTWTLAEGDGTIYTFSCPTSCAGSYFLSGAVAPASASGHGILTYSFDSSGRPLSVSFKQATGSASSETLTFNWATCTGYLFCVTGPDNGPSWRYAANASNQITKVDEVVGASTFHLLQLTYTGGRVSKVQNADDLDPTHSSPGYNGSHALTVVYDTHSPARVACVIEAPISGQQQSVSQSNCPGLSGSVTGAVWSFNYAPSCPGLKTPAVSHSYPQGTKTGCTLLINPNQQPSGPGVTVFYDKDGRPLEYSDARLSSTSPRITLVQYNDQNQLAWSEDEDGNPTDNSYDPLSNVLLSTTGPVPTGGGVTRPVTQYRYDEQTIGNVATPGNPLTGLAGSYWASATAPDGQPTLRENDPAPGSSQTGFSFSTASGWPPSGVTTSSGFVTRWTGTIKAPYTGDYTFTTVAYVNTQFGEVDPNSLLIDGFDAIENTSSNSTASSQQLYLTAGSVHEISLTYTHIAGPTTANVSLEWQCSDCSTQIQQGTLVPVAKLAPAWDNQTSVVSPAGRVSFQHYLDPTIAQPDYSLVKLGDGTNLVTSYVYDSLGRVVKKYMPKSNAGVTINSTTGDLSGTPSTTYETDYTYYGDGTTAAPPAACGGGTAVNQYGQLKQTSIPNGGLAADTIVYNTAGLSVADTNGKGSSCLSYDAENRVTSQTPHGDQAHPVTYTYDPNGAVLTTSNQNGTVTTYYDEAGRLSDETDTAGAEAHYCYDADSNTLTQAANTTTLGSTTCPLSTNYTTTYTYDPADELSTETEAGHQWSFFYDNRGNLRGTQYPNGTFSWVDTDPAGNTWHVFNRHGTISSTTTTPPADSNPLADYTYTYVTDTVYDDGKKDSEVRKSGSTSQTTTYSYDFAGRVTQVALPTGDCRSYSYDLDSNRTVVKDSPTGCAGTFNTTATYTYDPNTTAGTDQLTKIVAGSTTTNYGYTSDGQVSSQGTTSYTWNGLSQLATATVGSNTITDTYDPTGALKQRTSSSPATTSNYPLGGLFETNGSGTITTSYTDSPAGNLASYNGPPTSSSTPTYLYYDAHGNTAAEANTSGTLTANHTYDPFGAPLDSVPANTTVHRFVGRWDKQYDTTTSLILMGARPYDPNTGRFLAVDPIPGGSLNNYDYADQDPINSYDLSGTMPSYGQGLCTNLRGRAFRACVHVRWGMNAYCDEGSPFRHSKACALWTWTWYPHKVKPWMQKWIPHSSFTGFICGGGGYVATPFKYLWQNLVSDIIVAGYCAPPAH